MCVEWMFEAAGMINVQASTYLSVRDTRAATVRLGDLCKDVEALCLRSAELVLQLLYGFDQFVGHTSRRVADLPKFGPCHGSRSVKTRIHVKVRFSQPVVKLVTSAKPPDHSRLSDCLGMLCKYCRR